MLTLIPSNTPNLSKEQVLLALVKPSFGELIQDLSAEGEVADFLGKNTMPLEQSIETIYPLVNISNLTSILQENSEKYKEIITFIQNNQNNISLLWNALFAVIIQQKETNIHETAAQDLIQHTATMTTEAVKMSTSRLLGL